MKSIREMTADTEAYRHEIRRLVETDPKAKQIYIEMRAELAAVVCRHSGQRARRGGLTCH